MAPLPSPRAPIMRDDDDDAPDHQKTRRITVKVYRSPLNVDGRRPWQLIPCVGGGRDVDSENEEADNDSDDDQNTRTASDASTSDAIEPATQNQGALVYAEPDRDHDGKRNARWKALLAAEEVQLKLFERERGERKRPASPPQGDCDLRVAPVHANAVRAVVVPSMQQISKQQLDSRDILERIDTNAAKRCKVTSLLDGAMPKTQTSSTPRSKPKSRTSKTPRMPPSQRKTYLLLSSRNVVALMAGYDAHLLQTTFAENLNNLANEFLAPPRRPTSLVVLA
ncbi:hypothetical protein CTAYLR_005455 [Chrysophaeum taylorii]|uniref:Uncharacterized protein n=1 Tax=Chrysophaeum taylorii TaxID=2483200 RepID=A0AAD7UJN0_9STRA|nr:hypothetical protein CTAYLR_005455 [Chrysophaeum taylorii]